MGIEVLPPAIDMDRLIRLLKKKSKTRSLKEARKIEA